MLFRSGAALLAGCAEEAQYVDSKGTDTIVSIDRVDIQDFSKAADSLLQKLYDSPAFANAPRKPPIVAVSRIVNDTTTQFDTALFTNQIFSSITRSGKARVSATIGGTSDALTKDSKAASEFTSGSAPKNIVPDYVLRGKILEVKASAGRTKQTTYVFQLTLDEVESGTMAWVEQEEITKQGTKSAVGW